MKQTPEAPRRKEVDSARYRERLRELLPELRRIEGFPIGTDEDILALSDPPYYTACPNPFLDEFIAEHGTPYDEATDDYHREPFAADVSEGKNDPIYNAHSYHTKVPHKAIMRYILHYTKPGDIVFDGFCGSGMTGVAAQLCGDPDPEFKLKIENEWRAAGHPPPEWGARKAILCDLSPAATFIAYNYNTPVDVDAFDREAQRILDEVEAEYGWMYETLHTDGVTKGRINYTVWSDVFLCPNCGSEVVWWNAAVDESTQATVVSKDPRCHSCGTFLGTRRSQATESSHDACLDAHVTWSKRVPVRLYVSIGGTLVGKALDELDMRRIARATERCGSFPVYRMPPGDESRRNDESGRTHLHHLYTAVNRQILGALWQSAARAGSSSSQLRLVLLDMQARASIRNRHMPEYGHRHVGTLSGTLYVPMLSEENNLLSTFRWRIRQVRRSLRRLPQTAVIGTNANQDLTSIPSASVDYVFTDPPFGANISYSDLNSVWEAWLGVETGRLAEAVISRYQGKALVDYQHLMARCFEENYRILKPGRWTTVEFHNSSNAVWNAIQEAIQRAGFVVADVRVLDKKKGTTKQLSYANTVRQDLIISAYNPKAGFERYFRTQAGTERGAWDFVRQHLEQLPPCLVRAGRVEVVAERQNYLLYDRMLAFHVQRGATIPMSAASFYAGLRERFPERDGMYFTEVQTADYDQKRAQSNEIEQLSIFVVDEKSAIQWLRAELATHPQTFQGLQPKFLQELSQNRYEELPELRNMLEQNFLEDPATRRWRVPDPGKQADLEALRQRSLIAEFAEYLSGSGKLKRFRLEAIRAGVGDLWAKRDYRAIIRFAERLPDAVVQEDPALLMYYDNALTREGTG